MTALLLIDFQNDFFPFGTIEAKNADTALVQIVNDLMPRFDHVIALCDEHPADHNSFAANHLWRRPWQTMNTDAGERLLWPMHSVAGSFGADWAAGLHHEKIERTFAKGLHPDATGYSGFENPTLESWLHAAGVQQLYLVGTLLEYSVRHTALNAMQRGFATTVLLQGCGFLELHPGDSEQAIAEMQQAGVLVTRSAPVF
ncbi:MAG TPA: isochorismatase family protein [Saprospiraceae bacterium]|nr:isochorismatase family protein [Saprospiraceae bacterium]HRK81687.1 isochorismatase family protein [Saprospiraceae bacterium]